METTDRRYSSTCIAHQMGAALTGGVSSRLGHRSSFDSCAGSPALITLTESWEFEELRIISLA